MGEKCTWKKVDGRYVCMAKQCTHWRVEGCELGKVSLACDNEKCKWNANMHCLTMDVNLDEDGKCLDFVEKDNNCVSLKALPDFSPDHQMMF